MLSMAFWPSERHPTAVFFMVLRALEFAPSWNERRTGEGFCCMEPDLLSTVCCCVRAAAAEERGGGGQGAHMGEGTRLCCSRWRYTGMQQTCFETRVTVCTGEDAGSCFGLLLHGPQWHLMARHQTAPRLGRAKWRKSWDCQTFIIWQGKVNSVSGENPYMLY